MKRITSNIDDYYSISKNKKIETYLYYFFLAANDHANFKYGARSLRELSVDEIRTEIVLLCRDIIDLAENNKFDNLFCEEELMMFVHGYYSKRDIEFDEICEYMWFIIENLNELVVYVEK